MPFVRFSRDKRGYEHLYLIDPGRDRGRSRILYWFRTPPGVRIGRNPFDAETQKALERQNPDVQFDWPQIVAAKIAPPVQVESWREKRRVERAIKRARAEDAAVDIELDGTIEAPLEETVEVADGEVLDQAQMDTPPHILEEPLAAPPLAPGADTSTGPASAARRRRRRRGRRRQGPETGPVSGAGTGELDPPTSDSESSNEE